MLIPVYFLTSWLNRRKTTRIGLKGPRSSLSRPPARRRGHNVTPHHWYRANPFLTLCIQRYVSVSRSIFFFLPFALNFIICLFRLNRVSQACPPPRSVPRKCPLTRPHGEKERETHSENPPVSSIIYLFQFYCKFEN